VLLPKKKIKAKIISRQEGVLAGVKFAGDIFRLKGCNVKIIKKDSAKLKSNQIILQISGNAGTVLSCERTALNLLSRMSGISTQTNFLVSNFRIIIFPSLISLVFGIIIVMGINTVTSKLTHKYLDIKNQYTKDNDYLAALTENGIWIKDKIDGNTNIIRAKRLSKNSLIDVSIYKFDENNESLLRIETRNADISKHNWKLSDATIYYNDSNNISGYFAEYSFVSHFEINSIKNIFSNLDAISFWELNKLKENYKYLGYSTKEIESEFQRALSFPFFLMSMTLLAGAIVMNVKYRGNYLSYVIITIILSVIIFYLNDLSRALGQTEQISLIMSVWTPLSIVLIFSSIGMIHVNEK